MSRKHHNVNNSGYQEDTFTSAHVQAHVHCTEVEWQLAHFNRFGLRVSCPHLPYQAHMVASCLC